jgi:diguanylate cyclase
VREIEALSEQVRVLARLARTDPLTGLANRRGWDEQLARELARARRSGEALSVALLDLDDFEAFNDAHGHQAGDRLLLEAAAAWNGQLRDVDILCRWSGDEFAVLLPACSRAQAAEVIARPAGRHHAPAVLRCRRSRLGRQRDLRRSARTSRQGALRFQRPSAGAA